MKVLGLFSTKEFPYQIGASLGEGADGEVRELSNDKVIKLSIIYDLDYSNLIEDKYLSLTKILSSIKEDNSCLAKLFDYGKICTGKRQTVVGEQKYLIHFMVMEKLYKITEDEKKIFHTILSHEDASKLKKYSASDVQKILNNLRRGLDFSEKDITIFYNQFVNLKYYYDDIHVRNIMKNKLGQFKLIDFDRMRKK